MKHWTSEIDPSTVPDDVLKSERARRNMERARTAGALTGRPRIMRRCARCGAEMSATELRRHGKCSVNP